MMEKHCECKVSWKFMNPLTVETGQNNDAVELARVFMGCLAVLSTDFPVVVSSGGEGPAGWTFLRCP